MKKWTVYANTPRVLLDESSGATSGTKRNWPQMNTDKKEARTRIPLLWVSIRVHLRSSVAKLVLPAIQPKGRNYGRKPKNSPRPAIFHLTRNEHSPRCLRPRDEENVTGFAKVPLGARASLAPGQAKACPTKRCHGFCNPTAGGRADYHIPRGYQGRSPWLLSHSRDYGQSPLFAAAARNGRTGLPSPAQGAPRKQAGAFPKLVSARAGIGV
jgi:hypothetical protein